MLTKAFLNLRPVGTRGFAISSAPAKRVVVTGAAGQISYSVLFRIARYNIFSKDL